MTRPAKRGALRACLAGAAMALACGGLTVAFADTPSAVHCFPMVEASFGLPDVHDNWFTTNIWAEVILPSGGRRVLPAFFDGTNAAGCGIWRVRHTPSEMGRHSLKVLVGDPAAGVEPTVSGFSNREYEVTGPPLAQGFVRLSPETPTRFQFDTGEPYYPIGMNAAWEKSRATKMTALFEKMGAAGLNWSRVWMTHFYKSSNLDWVWGKPIARGTLDLQVARLWDQRIRAAERSGLRLQVVLQHHGQYSTQTSSDWRWNPWNAAKGGFLATPDAFFTDPTARELTRMKWRYIVARWGYSPAIMAWELFNEVELTDAYTGTVVHAVAGWHADMSAYLRDIDPYRHLITSSAPPLDDPVWRTMDYYQPHAYPQDVVTRAMAAAIPPGLPVKPCFLGEMGRGTERLDLDDGRDLRCILWPSLLANDSGAAQYWSWTAADTNNLWPFFLSATRFAAMTGLTGRRSGKLIEARIATEARADISFGGGVWGPGPDAEIDVPSDGRLVQPPATFSAYVHGAPDKIAEGYPGSVTLVLDARLATTVSVAVAQVSHFGAGIAIELDDNLVATNAWETSRTQVLRKKPVAIGVTMSVPVPAGRHRVTIRGTGPDWFLVSSFRVAAYVPALRAVARGSANETVAWIVNQAGIEYPPLPDPKAQAPGPAGPRPEPAAGTLSLPGLNEGRYSVMWWDTSKGCELSRMELNHTGGPMALSTPPIASDAAVWIHPL